MWNATHRLKIHNIVKLKNIYTYQKKGKKYTHENKRETNEWGKHWEWMCFTLYAI